MLKNIAQSILSIRRPHNDTCINVSNISSFNWLLQSLFTQFCLENPNSHITVFVNPKLQSCWDKVAELKLQELLEFGSVCSSAKIGVQRCFYLQIAATIVFREAFTLTSGNFAEHIFVKCPKKKRKILMTKMAFYRCWRLQYWTLIARVFFGGIKWVAPIQAWSGQFKTE